jgi:hypothetical protein
VNHAHAQRLHIEVIAGGKRIKQWVSAHVECQQTDASKSRDLDKCEGMRLQYEVIVGVSWGKLNKNQQKEWTELGCNSIDDPLLHIEGLKCKHRVR